MRKPPKKWIQKTARRLRELAEKSGKHFSVSSSKVAARNIWEHGMKKKCRTKAINKYGK